MKHIIIIGSLVFSVITKSYAQESVYKTIVLKTGAVQITEYEFEKNFNRAFPESTKNNREISILTKKKDWVDYYINRTYFLADAYQKGYTDDSRVNYDVTRAGKYMLTKPYGLYEERILFNNVKISEQDVSREYEKRSKYLVSFFFSKSLNEMNNWFASHIPKTREEFDEAIKTHADLRFRNLFEDTLLCACQFNEKRIGLDTLQVNQVSKPFVTSQGVYLFLIKRKGDIPETYGESEKVKITKLLTTQKKDSIRTKYQKQLLKTLSIVIDTVLVKEIINRIQKDEHYFQNNYAIDKALFKDIQDKMLFQYRDGKEIKSVILDEFINYFNQYITRYPLATQADVYSYIEYFPVEEVYYKEAIALGMDKEIKYQMDERNYRNNVINYYYDKDNFYDSIEISDQELLEYYNNNLNQFTDTDAVNVAAFYFNTLENAQKAINLKQGLSEFKKSSGIVEFNLKENFNQVERFYRHSISTVLKKLSVDEFSEPIEIKNLFLVLRKYVEPGIRINPFEDVKAEVKERVYQMKLENLKAQKLSHLKQKFELITSIDYNRYLQ